METSLFWRGWGLGVEGLGVEGLVINVLGFRDLGFQGVGMYFTVKFQDLSWVPRLPVIQNRL